MECYGTGWDPEQVDIDRFRAAVEALEQKVRAAGRGVLSWELMEDGVSVGRTAGEFGSVRVADFLLSREDEE